MTQLGTIVKLRLELAETQKRHKRLHNIAADVVKAVRKNDDWTEPMEALMRVVDEESK